MDAADLRMFQSVASTGSMSKAALELNTVQSNVTARIKSLEDEVGFALFERTNRGVTLTAAGQRLLPFAARAARLLDDARRAVADEGTPSGMLTIGSLDTTAALHLSPVLAGYVTAYPAVDLSLRTGTTCELIEQVLDRRLDGAYVCGPAHHPDLQVEPFVREELVILTAPGITSFEALSRKPDLKIVVLKAGCSYRLQLEAMLAGAASSACDDSSSAPSKRSSPVSAPASELPCCPERCLAPSGSADAFAFIPCRMTRDRSRPSSSDIARPLPQAPFAPSWTWPGRL